MGFSVLCSENPLDASISLDNTMTHSSRLADEGMTMLEGNNLRRRIFCRRFNGKYIIFTLETAKSNPISSPVAEAILRGCEVYYIRLTHLLQGGIAFNDVECEILIGNFLEKAVASALDGENWLFPLIFPRKIPFHMGADFSLTMKFLSLLWNAESPAEAHTQSHI